MSKEKTEFEIIANTLKAMSKNRTAKVKDGRAALMAIFIDRVSHLAQASDGYKLAILNIDGHTSPDEICELAFYADMQAVEYANGWALVTAKKKEAFIKAFGNGLAEIDTNDMKYPSLLRLLPTPASLNHVSNTHATFLPSYLQAIDRIVTAAEQNDEFSVTAKLYGENQTKIHVALYKNLLVGVTPFATPQEYVETIPNGYEYNESIRFVPTENPEDIESTTRDQEENEEDDQND